MRGLQAQSVPLGTDVVMSVRLSKPAAGKAVWSINGGKIPASHTRIRSDTREELYTLTIAKERIQKFPDFFLFMIFCILKGLTCRIWRHRIFTRAPRRPAN